MGKTSVPFPNCLEEIYNSPFYSISCTCKKKKMSILFYRWKYKYSTESSRLLRAICRSVGFPEIEAWFFTH